MKIKTLLLAASIMTLPLAASAVEVSAKDKALDKLFSTPKCVDVVIREIEFQQTIKTIAAGPRRDNLDSTLNLSKLQSDAASRMLIVDWDVLYKYVIATSGKVTPKNPQINVLTFDGAYYVNTYPATKRGSCEVSPDISVRDIKDRQFGNFIKDVDAQKKKLEDDKKAEEAKWLDDSRKIAKGELTRKEAAKAYDRHLDAVKGLNSRSADLTKLGNTTRDKFNAKTDGAKLTKISK